MSNTARRIVAALANIAVYAAGFVAGWYFIPYIRRGDLQVSTGGVVLLVIAAILSVNFLSQPLNDFLERCGFARDTFIGETVGRVVGSMFIMAVFAVVWLLFPRVVSTSHPLSWIFFMCVLSVVWSVGNYVEQRIKNGGQASKSEN